MIDEHPKTAFKCVKGLIAAAVTQDNSEDNERIANNACALISSLRSWHCTGADRISNAFADKGCKLTAAQLDEIDEWLVWHDDLVHPNPRVVINGGEPEPSSETKIYLSHRSKKKLGSIGVSLAGSAASASTAGVNVASATREASSVASTSAHLLGLEKIAKSYADDTQVQAWLEVIMEMKQLKLTKKVVSLVGDLTPISVLSTGASIASAVLSVGATSSDIVHMCASQVHYNARMNPRGAGYAICKELLTRRTITALFGSYDVDAYVGEPGGWLVIADKIGLL